jgi:hypothetical protein
MSMMPLSWSPCRRQWSAGEGEKRRRKRKKRKKRTGQRRTKETGRSDSLIAQGWLLTLTEVEERGRVRIRGKMMIDDNRDERRSREGKGC